MGRAVRATKRRPRRVVTYETLCNWCSALVTMTFERDAGRDEVYRCPCCGRHKRVRVR